MMHAISRSARLARMLLLAIVLWLGADQARADSCVASMTDISFGTLNPLAGADAYASGTLTVTCTWTVLNLTPPLLLLPAVTVCADLGAGSGGGGNPRYLDGPGGKLAFNLYTDTTYAAAAIWGGAGLPGTLGIPTQFGGLLKLGSVTRSFPVYGKIAAGALAAASTTAGSDAVYASSFAGHGVLHASFSGIQTQPCTAGASTGFGFQVRATVANNCVIQAGRLDFGSNSILGSARRTSGALGVQCTANHPYQISFNGGLHGSAGARRMKNAVTGETIAYSLSNSPDGVIWGDGSGGTATVGGVGSGAVQSVPVHGTVPAQRTPSPGVYGDTVTATLYF